MTALRSIKARLAAGVSAMALSLAGSAAVAATKPFDLSAREQCEACAAIVVSIGDDDGDSARIATALAERGYDVQVVADATSHQLESRIGRFLRGSDRYQSLFVWYQGRLVERDGGQAIAGVDTQERARDRWRLDSIRLEGLIDQLQETRVEDVVLALDAESPEADLRLNWSVAGGPQIVIVSASGASAGDAAARLEPLLRSGREAVDADRDGVSTVEELQSALGDGFSVASLAPAEGDGATTATPSRPLGGLLNSSDLLDLSKLQAPRRKRAYARALDEEGVDGLKQFQRDYCDGVEFTPECERAVGEIRQRESQMSRTVLECHQLATHPSDPAAPDAGVPDSRLDAARAQRACFEALKADPDNPRLLYQLGRALERLGNPEALRYYRAAADAGYAIASYSLGRMLSTDDDTSNDAEALRRVREAAEKNLLNAQLLYASMLQRGFAGVRDLIEARRILQQAARRSPLGAIALAELLLSGAEREQHFDQVRRLLSRTLRGGVADANRRRVHDLMIDTSEKQLSVAQDARSLDKLRRALNDLLREGVTTAHRDRIGRMLLTVQRRMRDVGQAGVAVGANGTIAGCRRALDFEPMDFFSLRDVKQAGNIDDGMRRIRRQKMQRMDVKGMVDACDALLTRGSGPTGLRTRYAVLLAELEAANRDLGQTKGVWPRMLRAAADRGDTTASLFVGVALVNQPGASALQINDGIAQIRKAHQAGISEATFYLAMTQFLLRNREGVQTNVVFGLQLLDSIANEPVPIYKAMLANAYSVPARVGLPPTYKNERLANRYLTEARELNFLDVRN